MGRQNDYGIFFILKLQPELRFLYWPLPHHVTSILLVRRHVIRYIESFLLYPIRGLVRCEYQEVTNKLWYIEIISI
jgi:hypothetical protein